MKLLQGQTLVHTLRSLGDNAKERLWIAVPFLGSPSTVRCVLGRDWFENPGVSVRLLTDTSDMTGIDTESLRLFHDRGELKTLLGLHAKLYIADSRCVVTSANLTNTALSKRYEVGSLYSGRDAEQILDLYKRYWRLASSVNIDQLHTAFRKRKKSRDETCRPRLPELWPLPEDPGAFTVNLEKRFLNYARLLADYMDFAGKYQSIQRLWPRHPLYLETDGFLNYLYHDADAGKPSQRYKKRKPRRLTPSQQVAEIRRYARLYRKWNEGLEEDDIEWRLENSQIVRDLLKPRKVMTLKRSEIREVLNCLNSLNSYPINKTRILNNNKLNDIRAALDQLVNGTTELADRMNFANRIHFLGQSSMNEIIGFAHPNRYPLMNKNSNCGLRLFGYQVKAYS
jgi:hypothetical protein